MYRHILISTDGSEVAQAGVEQGISLARAIGAKVTIVTVSEVIAYVGRVTDVTSFEFYREHELIQKNAAERVLANAKEQAVSLGVEADTVYLGVGPPAELIVQTAKDRNCDLIVMSSHGRRGLRRLLLGSVTAEVVVISPVPVLVVR